MVLQTYGDAIRTVFKANGGQASSVNAGLPLLTGDAVIILDSDDMLDPTAVKKTISFFRNTDGQGQLATGDRRPRRASHRRNPIRKLSIGNYRKRALRVGPASHVTPSGSGNMCGFARFHQSGRPIPENDLRGIVDAWLFSFSPFFGKFEGCEELAFYRVHGKNFTARYSAGPRLADWEHRPRPLHAWLTEQGESVEHQRWRKHNPFYQRLQRHPAGGRPDRPAAATGCPGRARCRTPLRSRQYQALPPGAPGTGRIAPFRPNRRRFSRLHRTLPKRRRPCRSRPQNLGQHESACVRRAAAARHAVLYEDDWIVIADAAANI